MLWMHTDIYALDFIIYINYLKQYNINQNIVIKGFPIGT